MDRALLPQLSVFAVVARHGSFRAAARELTIAPSAVTHAIASLEERLGIRLLARTTRSVALTEEGARLLERLRPALSEIDLAVEATIESGERPAGNLRLTVPRTAAELELGPRLGEFARRYPDITLELVIDDRFADMVEGGFDAGVRLGESLQQDMIAVPIGPPLRAAVVASPAFVAGLGRMPEHPRDLLHYPCIRFRFSSGRIYRWEFGNRDGEFEIDVGGPLILDEDRLITQAAIDGAGFALQFEGYVSQAIGQGRLVRLLDAWCPVFDGFSVYYPSRRQMRPALRAFVDFFRWRNAG